MAKRPSGLPRPTISKAAASVSALDEYGDSGLRRSGGQVIEEFLPRLRGRQALEMWREMRENDPIVGAELFAIDMLIRSVPWTVTPADDTPAAIEGADFLETCLDDMNLPWVEVISEILSFLPMGFSVHEIVYKRRNGPQADSDDPSAPPSSLHADGKIGWRKLPIRAQETITDWLWDANGGLQGCVQQNLYAGAGGIITLPINKMLLFRTTAAKGNPEGRSILRSGYQPYYYVKRIREYEAIGIERDLAGLPTMGVPAAMFAADATPARRAVLDAIKDTIRNVRRNEQEGVVYPLEYDERGNKMFDFALLSSGGSRQFDTDKVIMRYKQEQAMTVLADVILLGHEKIGSFALASSKTTLFSTAIGAWLDEIAGVFNTHAIPRLFRLNGMPTDALPKLTHGDIETVDLAELGEFISKLAASGFPLFPDGGLQRWIREQAGMPISEIDDLPVDDTFAPTVTGPPVPAPADDDDDEPLPLEE